MNLTNSIWENRIKEPQIQEWLSNFDTSPNTLVNEQLHALYLLSQFMYFGDLQMRELLKALYRDLYKYPIVERIRKDNGNTTDSHFISDAFDEELDKTRFLGVGNPSESGTHLLYYFRQENLLKKELFIHGHEIFARSGSPPTLNLRRPDVKRYVFIDDFCGSGDQASSYSEGIVSDIKNLDSNIEVAYYMLFSTSKGLKTVRDETMFDRVECVFELDNSYKCFEANSRYFYKMADKLDKTFAKNMCLKYGQRLVIAHPLGYRDCQLLIGFHHNIPDNTLPVIWYSGTQGPIWKPIFKRYPKKED